MTRECVTDWTSWRDIFESETEIPDLPARYKSHVVHTWPWPLPELPRGWTTQQAEMRLSSFVCVEPSGNGTTIGGDEKVYLDAVPTRQAIDMIASRTLHVEGDTMNLRCTLWKDTRALVYASHGKIIAGVWLAKIHSHTIPLSCGHLITITGARFAALWAGRGSALAFPSITPEENDAVARHMCSSASKGSTTWYDAFMDMWHRVDPRGKQKVMEAP